MCLSKQLRINKWTATLDYFTPTTTLLHNAPNCLILSRYRYWRVQKYMYSVGKNDNDASLIFTIENRGQTQAA